MQTIMEDLEAAGAVYEGGHFVYAKKGHGPKYIDLDRIFPNVGMMLRFGRDLVYRYMSYPTLFDTIAVPATGGIGIGYMMCAYLEQLVDGPGPKLVWADKIGKDEANNDIFAFERAGFTDHIRGKRVLVGEDILNSGGSVASVCREVEKEGGEVIGVSVVVSRGNATAEKLQVPRLEALQTVQFEAMPPDQCTLCADKVPIITNIGHGAEFQLANPDYPGGYTVF